MNRLEHDLRESLKDGEPPEGFAEKIIARAYATDTLRHSWVSRKWIAAAALVVLMIGGGFFVQEQRRRAENDRRKEQLMVGLQITASKLQRVHERLLNINLHIEQ